MALLPRDQQPPIRLFEDSVSRGEDSQRKRQHAPVVQSGMPMRRGSKGRIEKVNREAYTYDVVEDGSGGRAVTMGRLMQDTSDASLLPIGTTVAITHEYGQPLIAGVIPNTVSRAAQPALTPTISNDPASNNEPDQTSTGGYCRMPHMPTNLEPGDKVLANPSGNMIGALSGGLNVMRSSGMAQVRTSMVDDLVEIFCRNFRHISDFGTQEIKNTNGKVTWTFRGGTDQVTECGPDQENWTVRVDIGGEDLFHFALTKGGGTTLFKLRVNHDGQVELYGAQGLDLTSGRDHCERALGNRATITEGDDVESVTGQQSCSVEGNRRATVSGSETRVVGNDLTETAVRHLTESTGGQHLETVTGGNPLMATPGAVARKTRIVNGSWEVEIGNPLSAANPAALAGYNVKTYTGDIKLALMRALVPQAFLQIDKRGNVSLQTLMGLASLKTAVGMANVDGTTVHLGPLAAAVQPVVKGFLYSAAFSSFATALSTACTVASSAAIPGLPVDGSVVLALATAVNAAAAALLGALPGTLSTKSFTA